MARAIRAGYLGRFQPDNPAVAGRVGVLDRVCDRLAYRQHEVIRFIRWPALAGEPFPEQTASQGRCPEIYRQFVAKCGAHTQVPLQTPIQGPG